MPNTIDRDEVLGSIDCLRRAVARLDEVVEESNLDPLTLRKLAVVRELIRDGRGMLYGLL